MYPRRLVASVGLSNTEFIESRILLVFGWPHRYKVHTLGSMHLGFSLFSVNFTYRVHVR